jgi:hypothetical protein
MSQDMTDEAIQGFLWLNGEGNRSDRNPYIPTSSSWEAWQIGRWLDVTGRPKPDPKEVRTSRGSTYHVRDMKVRVHANGEVTRLT